MSLRALRPESPEQIVPFLEVAEAQRFPWWGPNTWVSPDLGPNLDGLSGVSGSVFFEQTQAIRGAERRLPRSSIHKVLSLRDINGTDRFHLVVIHGSEGTERKNDYAYVRAAEEARPLRDIVSNVLFSFIQQKAYRDVTIEREAVDLRNAVWAENDRQVAMAGKLLQSMIEGTRGR